MNNELGIKIGKIEKFQDLNVWKEGHQLVIQIYKISRLFPKEEAFGLTSQIRRAVVSITSNIAEGFGRQSYKDKHNFYQMAFGSIIEVRNQLLISRDVGYVNNSDFQILDEQAVKVEKICRGLIKKSREFYS
ncbi:MAG: four helix bundle protein [Candidatus Zambryskibacteria bacterium]|nr:four helix bundle protein [Candidatus Zambryskibacteria bacterium]